MRKLGAEAIDYNIETSSVTVTWYLKTGKPEEKIPKDPIEEAINHFFENQFNPKWTKLIVIPSPINKDQVSVDDTEEFLIFILPFQHISTGMKGMWKQKKNLNNQNKN